MKTAQGLNLVFEKVGANYSDDALLYQDILKYPIQSAMTNLGATTPILQFKERELARWLISHHKEYVEYYMDSNAHVPVNNRIENRLPRIKEKIVDLINFGLLKQVKTVQALTVEIDIPVYSLTTSGIFLAWLRETQSNEGELKCYAEEQVFGIVESYLESNDSSRASFLLKFFKNCHLKGCFLDSYDLPIDSRRRIHTEYSFLELFLDMENAMYWVLSKPHIFEETLGLLSDRDRRMALFEFKIKIEEYYNNQYPSKRWELLRYQKINDCSSITISGYCSNCHTKVPFSYNIINYLRALGEMAKPCRSGLVWGDCPDCGLDSASGPIMLLPSLCEMPQYYGFKPTFSSAVGSFSAASTPVRRVALSLSDPDPVTSIISKIKESTYPT